MPKRTTQKEDTPRIKRIIFGKGASASRMPSQVRSSGAPTRFSSNAAVPTAMPKRIGCGQSMSFDEREARLERR